MFYNTRFVKSSLIGRRDTMCDYKIACLLLFHQSFICVVLVHVCEYVAVAADATLNVPGLRRNNSVFLRNTNTRN